jgi:hypothetical protein
MPSLEKLKKQAKLVLRWHRDRYYPDAAQIRVLLPRYRHLTDPEGLAHSFRLSDAQELVARQNGFDSWPALKEGLSTMSDPAAAYLQSAGVVFHQTLRKEPCGAKTFIVRDPDGNLLLFAGPAE